MPVNPSSFTYATVDDFKQYQAGTGKVELWQQDNPIVLRILESVSRRMEDYLGGRTWGPRTETRLYDIGAGALRYDASVRGERVSSRPDYWPDGGSGIVPLDDWLLSVTALTASSVSLSAGTDYLLEPYNSSPKTGLKLTESTSKTLGSGQQALSIAGTWGWQNVTVVVTTLNGAISTTTDETIPVTAADGISAGATVKVDSEQMYVRSVQGMTLNVRRGVNGTTAATHSDAATVSVYEYPADVVEVCLEIARNRWTERNAGNAQTIGGGDSGIVISRPGAEERVLLKRLDVQYRAKKEQAGVYF